MLKKILILSSAALLLSCNSQGKKEPVTDIEVATVFIRNILDNDLRSAERYILKDDINQQYFERFEQQYHNLGKEELDRYKAADILINNMETINDSTKVVDYSNTYKKAVSTKLRLLWVNGKWLVDLKYFFEQNK